MNDIRPGWSYRGPVKNGTLLIDFKTWEKFTFRRKEQIDFNKDWNNQYIEFKENSNFDYRLNFIPAKEQDKPINWSYCLKIKNDYRKKYDISLEFPNHASFLTDNLEWLLNQSRKNLEDSSLSITQVKSNKIDLTKHITLFTNDDEYHRGEGSTLSIAALDLFGKTFNVMYEAKRPSLSYLTGDIEISHFVGEEPTIEIYHQPRKNTETSFKLRKHNFYSYEFFMTQPHKDHISKLLGEKCKYYGKFHLLEGNFHIVDVERIR
jgi:hypothetical protein